MQDTVEQKPPFLLFDKEAQDALIAGVTLMYQAVCTTLSPKGRNVAIQRPWGYPIVVHDGVTVAKEVKSRDRFVQMGINLIKEAASKTNEEAGDGTTTSTLIAYEAIIRGIKLKNEGINPMVLREELNTALDQVKTKLKTLTLEAKTQSDLVQVATISSANKEIGELVGKIVFEMGADGLVTTEESGNYDTFTEKTDGMSIARGFATPYFVTDPFRNEATVKNPTVVVTDKSITTNIEIIPIIEYLASKGKKNIVIVGNVGGQALQTLVINKAKGIINCLTIDPPGGGEAKAGFLEDIALLTGGKVISKELGLQMEEFLAAFDDSFLGSAVKVQASSKASLIVGGGGHPDDIKEQVGALRLLLSKATEPSKKEMYEERLAKLTTGVAVVRVGAKTEMELREKLERVKDAVGAAQSALKEGIVAGGGVTFLNLASAITGNSEGDKLLREVLEQPIRKVMVNCGESQQDINGLIKDIKDHPTHTWGYEALSGQMKDLIKAGVVDPARVIRLCLENGLSVATSVLTTDVLVNAENELDNVRE